MHLGEARVVIGEAERDGGVADRAQRGKMSVVESSRTAEQEKKTTQRNRPKTTWKTSQRTNHATEHVAKKKPDKLSGEGCTQCVR